MNYESIVLFVQLTACFICVDFLLDNSRPNRYAIAVMVVVLGGCHGGVYQWCVELAAVGEFDGAGLFVLVQGAITGLWYVYLAPAITAFFRDLEGRAGG